MGQDAHVTDIIRSDSVSSHCNDTLSQRRKPTWANEDAQPQIKEEVAADASLVATIINTTLPHYHQSLAGETKVSLRAKSRNRCISITERNWSASDLCGWVMWNLSQVSPRGLDKIKDKTPEKFVLIRSHKVETEGVETWWGFDTL